MDSGESTAQYNAGGDDVAVATAKVSRTPVSGARNRGGKVTRGQDGGLHPRVILPTEVSRYIKCGYRGNNGVLMRN